MTKVKETWIETENKLKLKSYIYNPGKGLTAIIYCHGFTGNSSRIFGPRLCEELAKDNRLICRFDFRGHGESEGRFYDTSITSELQDLEHVTVHLYKNYMPATWIFIGHSFGDAIAMLYSIKHRVDGLVSLSGEGDLVKAIDLEFSEEQLKEFEAKERTKVQNWSKDGEMD